MCIDCYIFSLLSSYNKMIAILSPHVVFFSTYAKIQRSILFYHAPSVPSVLDYARLSVSNDNV